MLSPTIDEAKDRMTDAYQSIISMDQFATSVNDIIIVKLKNDPSWLPAVRTELVKLRALAGQWRTDRAEIWSPLLTSYGSYVATFDAIADQSQKTDLTKAQWIELLEKALLPSVSDQLSAAKASVAKLDTQRSGFSAILPAIDKSIAAGWVDLGDEEQDMLKLAEEIGGLTQLVTSYSAKLNSDVFSGGKSYVQSIVSLTYAAVSAGAEAAIPILGIAAAVFSISKAFYDIIEDNQDIIDTMNRIAKLQQTLSADAVALALTKGTLQILYGLEKQYLASSDALPEVVDMWAAEQIKVTDAINALKAGAQPDQYLDLLTLPIAETNWNVIQNFVREMAEIDVKMGLPVSLDIAKGTITQGARGA